MKRLSLLALAVVALAACQTVPTEIDEDLTQAELIQRAQEAVDQENWEAAIAYYEAIAERFPDDRTAVATARYEIAFIEYKRGNVQVAEAGFQELLAMYDFQGNQLPAWPRVLANKLLEDIRNEESGEPAADAS